MADKKPLVERLYYPVLFMFVITVLFVGILALFYHSSLSRVERLQTLQYQRNLISLFADSLSTVTKQPSDSFLKDDTAIGNSYKMYFKELPLNASKPVSVQNRYFQVQASGKVIGYCFDIAGGGLWGTMRALLGVTEDMKSIVNVVVYDNVETPGLGARITEKWFTSQFRNKNIVAATGQIIKFALVPEEGTPGVNDIRQITGATITSGKFADMLQVELGRITKQLGKPYHI